jgi:serine/threonine-protein kinase
MSSRPFDELVALQAAVAGRYEVEREIGRGGMGIVYRARDLALERPVAIKLLPPELAAHEDLRERFLREARTAAVLAHPHVVPIHLVEAHDQVVFFVMGYVDGETLSARVRRAGALPPLDVARVLREVAWALGYAHGRGIVHRDVKPDNILIEHATARAYVTDFGIARRTDQAGLTREGFVLGTAQFMSPEQAAGEAVDGRSDIYAVGIVAYFALTGRLPFDATTVQATLAMHLTQAPPPIPSLRSDLPSRLVDVVDRCLAKEPSARFQSAEELAEALDAVAAPGAEAAPLLRNWLRVAEQWQIVTWILGINSIVLIVLAPHLALVIVLLFFMGLIGLTLDLVTRTRLLLRQGYTHDDVRTAIWIEREARERELRFVLGDEAAAAQRRRVVRRWLVVAGIGLVGTVVAAVVQRRVPGAPRLVLTVAGFGSIAVLTLGVLMSVTGSARLQRSNALFYTAVWRRWFGRWFFRIVGRGLHPERITDRRGSRALIDDVAQTLPPGERAALAAVAAVFGQLEERAATLVARERELDRALAQAGVGVTMAAPGADSPLAAPPVGGGAAGPVGYTDVALLERRSSAVEQLRVARDEVAAQRANLQLAAGNLRIQLLRLRARVGTLGDLDVDLAAARALLGSAPSVAGGR